MWIHRSHVLTPLTKLQDKGVKFKWSKEQQTAFDNIKKIIAKEVLLSYPDFSTKPFYIYKLRLVQTLTPD